jgi:hypothetical protein
MSGSFTSSPPCATKVTSSRRSQIAVREKNTGSSSRSAAHPAPEDQQVVCPRVAPGGPGAPEGQRDLPRRVDPLRRLEERPTPSRHLFDGFDRPTWTPCRGAGRGRGRRTRR